jgi:hypothetical protein
MKQPRMHVACSCLHVFSHFKMHVCLLHTGVTHSFLHLAHVVSQLLEHSAPGGFDESSGFVGSDAPASTTSIMGGGAIALVGSGTASVGWD